MMNDSFWLKQNLLQNEMPTKSVQQIGKDDCNNDRICACLHAR